VAKDRPPTDTYDPDPEVYHKFGVSAPPAVATAPYAAKGSIQTSRQERPEERKLLHEMLTDAKRRGFTIMIFQAQSGKETKRSFSVRFCCWE
jgi:hypothetical protein